MTTPAMHLAADDPTPVGDAVLAEHFDYVLPRRAIAQTPAEPRTSARLLVAVDPKLPPDHDTVGGLPRHLGPGDVLVLNETKVLPARLVLRKATGGAAEVFLLEQVDPGDPARWVALVRPGRRLASGTILLADDGTAVVEVGDQTGGDGERHVRLLVDPTTHGSVPLPPYIHEPLADPERYQTVYARNPGSVAAPTAGLHLTTGLLDEIRAEGVEVHTVDLKIGLGTFRPITADRVADHVMHEERYAVPEATLEACRRPGTRVVAVGTTCVRALESASRTGALEGRTDLFIRPGFEFQVVDVLLTNFHQPRSSLLVLLSAFAGHDRWRHLYGEALAEGYRFLSFGDAMLVSRAGPVSRPC
ncbi:MAG TPA: tRNA preQ1(34) S-adenosylmethionine ribosyltransferase-isomerase QueA [Acidimicrobiales bacterium]|nr:tRNA preQ1(34) S-adenosylmethionine ribosyltransferase-isomerase QueA [Acidimicrobiales bacterium]